MRSTSSICLKCSCLLLFASFLSEPSAETETRSVLKESVTTQISGFKFRVLFEDQNLDQETRRVVLDDLREVFGHLPMYEARIPNKPSSFKLHGRTVAVTKMIDFVGGHRARPKELQDRFGFIVTIADIDYLVIPTALSDAYKKALAFIEKNHAAYTELQNFEKFMNNLKPDAIPDWDNLFYVLPKDAHEWTEKVKEGDRKLIAEKCGNWRYHISSLFNFRQGCMDIPSVDKELLSSLWIFKTTGKFFHKIPIIFHKGRWKMLLIVPDA